MGTQGSNPCLSANKEKPGFGRAFFYQEAGMKNPGSTAVGAATAEARCVSAWQRNASEASTVRQRDLGVVLAGGTDEALLLFGAMTLRVGVADR